MIYLESKFKQLKFSHLTILFTKILNISYLVFTLQKAIKQYLFSR